MAENHYPDHDRYRFLVHAYVDGELTGEERRAFENHLLECEPCRATVSEEQTLAAAVRNASAESLVPGSLRRRVETLVRGPRARRGSRVAVAAAAVVATVVLAAGIWLVARRSDLPAHPPTSPASDLASFAAQSHLRLAHGQLPLEVTSSDPSVVSAWFEGRVPFELELPDYPLAPGEQKPYQLQGGRLVSFRGDYAAYVTYRMSAQPISLLVISATAVLPEGGSTVSSGSLSFHIEPVLGLKVISWTDKGLTYALVSGVTVEGSRSCAVCHRALDRSRPDAGSRISPEL